MIRRFKEPKLRNQFEQVFYIALIMNILTIRICTVYIVDIQYIAPLRLCVLF